MDAGAGRCDRRHLEMENFVASFTALIPAIAYT
jgi:hypothetical protein